MINKILTLAIISLLAVSIFAGFVHAEGLKPKRDKVDYDNKKIEIKITPKKGDVNNDGKVDLADLDFLIDYLFEGGHAPTYLESGDLNEDGKITMEDLSVLIHYLTEKGLIDAKSPVIELINPDDNDFFETGRTYKDIEFEFIVRDDSEIKNCNIIIDGNVEETKNDIEKDSVNFFKVELDSEELYTWRIECTDIYGNKGISERWDFEIEREKDNQDSNQEDLPQNKDNSNQDTQVNPLIVLNEEDNDQKENNNLINFLAIALVLANIFLVSVVFVFGYRR